ncbi:SDR family NAD(P)-dependent oxidoreductase [Hwangdonia lutea]|uniref:SDR family NAD(P)-dependent oxidoreductase n=1 Tax=Hwangdonia lutea TaxID=3075823 RepID=A0AA97ELC0_9FLAO|nr:SDR family NAD(P)-dependent oxidoreductase [Hwangdonia sp. SCSIO 19198]WOD43347.1 SDR family NAD(P)-dependent oxidoreductase [Hwangdonia sp. SCSIO 19198]
MDASVSNHIQQLINDSGLLHSNTNSKKQYRSLDFSNDTILITGAAGSIGSELTKQLVHSRYKKLILVDIAESPLYELQQELECKTEDVEFIILNITDKASLKFIFESHQPTIVFHTAAYKHVPLMESIPYEAVKLNIMGTKLLADLSILYAVKKFIFISTDKAVNPISVMGMTKRIAERYLLQLHNQSQTKFIITRFGNIFGSSGSVVPLFLNQIHSGKPLTVTNKDVSRYFICKHKACNLILEIAAFEASNPSVYTFNMGTPIKIMDLAKTLTTFYNEDIAIKMTKIRPGEKLHENIVSKNESLIPTSHKDIMHVKINKEDALKPMNIDELFKLSPSNSISEIKSTLKKYI